MSPSLSPSNIYHLISSSHSRVIRSLRRSLRSIVFGSWLARSRVGTSPHRHAPIVEFLRVSFHFVLFHLFSRRRYSHAGLVSMITHTYVFIGEGSCAARKVSRPSVRGLVNTPRRTRSSGRAGSSPDLIIMAQNDTPAQRDRAQSAPSTRTARLARERNARHRVRRTCKRGVRTDGRRGVHSRSSVVCTVAPEHAAGVTCAVHSPAPRGACARPLTRARYRCPPAFTSAHDRACQHLFQRVYTPAPRATASEHTPFRHPFASCEA